ncbi:hypothetical protein LCGC14_0847060 [marine sediment metagenome]|uniref:Uncharacterized protein n=1 Tax=marine sediment metagenome TaxID=412755 RepID=A0A0F9RW88_9ZZZZ
MYWVLHSDEVQFCGDSLINAKAAIVELIESGLGSDDIDLIEGHTMEFEIERRRTVITILKP